MGLSVLLDHTEVMHELLCHPDIDLAATDAEGRTAQDMVGSRAGIMNNSRFGGF